MADVRHDWRFSAVVRQDQIYSVAACILCGSIRTGRASVGEEEAHIDLRGDCPRVSQAPEDDTPPGAPVG